MRQEQAQHRAEGHGDCNTGDDFKHAGRPSDALSFAKTNLAHQLVDPLRLIRRLFRLDDYCPTHLLRLFPFLFGGHRQLALENLGLRQQLAVYKRAIIRPRLRRTDRLFWIGLARMWTGWRQALVIVTPATVLRLQRRRFREYWTRLSRRPTGGRPRINAEIAALVRN